MAKTLKSLGNKVKDAHNKSRSTEAKLPGGGTLPDGIEDGVAQLSMAKFDEFKSGDMKGELYFMAQGVIVSPVYHTTDGKKLKIQGKHTKFGPVPLCDTPNRSRKTAGEHYEYILNQLKLLGLDASDIDLDDMEDAVQELVEAAPYFKFRTWKGKATKQFPNPRVNESWEEALEDFDPDVDDEVQDETDDEEEDVEEEVDEETGDDSSTDEVTDDILELGTLADNQDDQAQTKLTELALANNWSQDDIDGANSWLEIAEYLHNDIGGDEEVEEESNDSGEETSSYAELGATADEEGDESQAATTLTEACESSGIDINQYSTWTEIGEALDQVDSGEEGGEFEPSKGEIYNYKPKGARNLVSCEVTAVFATKKTCNLKNLDKGTTIKGVPWDKLES